MAQRVPVARVVDQAIGTHEAAGLMGVHFSAATRMFDRGWIAGREMKTRGNRRYVVFDGSDCDANFREYDAKVVARGGMNDRRPRAWLDTRIPTLRYLARITTPIAFDDAIGVYEAAEILSVHSSMVPRLCKSGDIVGRLAMGRKGLVGANRVWIISRKSCVANARKARSEQADGSKVGRHRKMS